jgi:hypothetical protein
MYCITAGYGVEPVASEHMAEFVADDVILMHLAGQELVGDDVDIGRRQ